MLVVTKADLGAVALRSRRDLSAALRSLGARDTPVVAVSLARARRRGFDELVDALDAHRARLDVPARRLAARRASALADFAVEHGERGLRALGGRRAAPKLLAEQDAALDVPALTRALEAGGGAMSRARLLVDLALMLGAFVAAQRRRRGSPARANLGTALSFGQIGFALAAVYVLLRR